MNDGSIKTTGTSGHGAYASIGSTLTLTGLGFVEDSKRYRLYLEVEKSWGNTVSKSWGYNAGNRWKF